MSKAVAFSRIYYKAEQVLLLTKQTAASIFSGDTSVDTG